MKSVIRTALLSALLGSSVAFVSVSVQAQVEDDPAIEMARERFKEGVRYYDQRQYEKARAAFLQAYALKKHPAVLLNLAQSELRSGRDAEAATHFAEYLREAQDTTTPEYGEAQKGLATAKEKLAEVTVTVTEPGAEVFVDGEPHGKSPLAGPLYLVQGAHRIEARKGQAVAEVKLEATAGSSTNVSLELTSSQPAVVPAAPTATTGTPSESAEAPSGTGKEGFFEWFGHKPLAWGGAGLTLAGIGGGIGFGLAASSKYDGANRLAQLIRLHVQDPSEPNPLPGSPPCRNPTPGFVDACAEYVRRVDDGDAFKRWSIVSWVVAGAAAGGTLVYYLVDAGPSRDARAALRPRRVAVVPVASPEFQGIGMSGEF